MKVCDYIWDYLASIGVRHVFGLPGGGGMHMFNALHGREDIKFIGLLHEQAAAYAAEAYSQFENIGVCLVTSGPGGTNAVTGVAAAWTNSRPVLFISGQVQRCDLADHEQRFNGAQEIDIISLVAPITAAVYQLHCGQKIKDVLESVVRMAQCERPAPVWLDIPLDVQCEELMSDLKLCPFCGKQPTIIQYFIKGIANHLNYFIKCSCGIRTRNRKNINGAVDDWNRGYFERR